MPSYSPLPNIELDPRLEAELVQAAARRVYESSAATINDFSSGSPIMALLEGQAFAQAEFLQFANQFPESVLVEWIGPFLGAQRKTGTGSLVDIEFTIVPRDAQFDVFSGFQMSTDSSLTGGTKQSFVTIERLVIPAGQSTGIVKAISTLRGSVANVEANTITITGSSLSGVKSLTNPEAATGGTDPELLSEVKERFFSLIRRRNPVSAEDWQDFFSDALGVGSAVTVLPRRSESKTYRYGGPYTDMVLKNINNGYGGDYIRTNPSVSFFVLNPDGTPITLAQEAALTNLIKWSLPVEFLGYVNPMEVDDVDFTLDLKYDASKPYAQNLTRMTTIVRNNLFSVMTPNAVFSNLYSQSVNDVESALNTTFPLTLGVVNQYTDPDISSIKAYYPPKNLSVGEYRGVLPLEFQSGDTIKTDDLVIVQGNASVTYYPAVEDFTPTLTTKTYHANLGNLHFELIRNLSAGLYKTGDVISDTTTGTLHVVLSSFDHFPSYTITSLIEDGFISEAKEYRSWEEGTYNPINDSTKQYNPDIILFEDGDTPYVTDLPLIPGSIEQTLRPGYPIYVVEKEFDLEADTTSLGTSQNEGLVSQESIDVFLLTPGETYQAGEWVKTPTPVELVTNIVTKENCYLDQLTGVTEIYAKVVDGFVFSPTEDDPSYKNAVDILIANSELKVVNAISFVDCKGVSTFAAKPFRYQARFKIGEYIRYRPLGGFDAGELEECSRQNEKCANVTETCRKLLDSQLPLPRYFYVMRDFTPNTTDLDELIQNEIITEVESGAFLSDYTVTIRQENAVFSSLILEELIEEGEITGTPDLTEGDTVLVLNELGDQRGLYKWSLGEFDKSYDNGELDPAVAPVDLLDGGVIDGVAATDSVDEGFYDQEGGQGEWILHQSGLPSHRDMFRFAPGDVASFRSVSDVRQYKAEVHITPLLSLELYYDNGLFTRTNVDKTVEWFDPTYNLEDIIFNEKRGSTSFYRTTRSFTPPKERTVWNDTLSETTPRIEEIYGNLLKFVRLADCGDHITSRVGDNASTIKLGSCQFNLTPKAYGTKVDTFVFESTNTISQSAPMSDFPESSFQYGPVDYGTGTLAL